MGGRIGAAMDSKNGWALLREHAAAIASTFAVLAVLGYAIGWFYLLAYLREFNAGWLLPYVPTSALLSHAEWPIVLLALMIFLANIEKPKFLWDPYLQNAMLRYGLVAVFGLTILLSGLLRSRLEWYIFIRNLAFLNMFVWVVVVAYSFKLIFLALGSDRRASNPKASHILIFFSLFATFGGLYMIPQALGHAAALHDLHPGSSGLHIVEALDGEGQAKTSRLLLATEARIYIIKINKPGGGTVMPVTWDRVISISSPRYEGNKRD